MRTRLIAIGTLLFAPFTANAAPSTFKELIDLLVTMIDTATGVLIVAAIVIYFFGISTGLMAKGESGQSKLRTQMMWGLGTIFLIVSIWGILRVLQNTLFIGDPYSPDTAGQLGDSDSFDVPDFTE